MACPRIGRRSPLTVLIAGTGLGVVVNDVDDAIFLKSELLRTVIDAPVSTNSLTGKSTIVPSSDRSLGLITMSVFAAYLVAHAEYELSEEEGSVAVDSCVWLFETRGSLIAVTAVSCTWESWITFSTALFSSLSATETRSLQLWTSCSLCSAAIVELCSG